MSDPNDLSGQIQNTAANPSQAAADGVSASAQSLPDLIAADKYLKANQANQKAPFGIAFVKLRAPGAQC